MADAFYERRGDRYAPTELTRGPWDPRSQHASPPAALIGREIERLEGGPRRRVGRITFEILRPVPIRPLAVSARLVRPGRSVEMIEAELGDGEDVLVRATAWRLRESRLELASELTSAGGSGAPGKWSSTLRPGFAPPGPEEGGEAGGFFPVEGPGYHTAMDYRFVSGSFLEPGPATVWMRPRHPLVAGEEITPLERALLAADSGNGVSATLDFERFVFINVDLSVHLARPPAGEWICLDALTIPEPDGLGITDTALSDERGPIGRAIQTLLVAER